MVEASDEQKKKEIDTLYTERLKLLSTADSDQKHRALMYKELTKSQERVRKLRSIVDEANERIRQLEKLVKKQQLANNSLQARCLALKSKAKSKPAVLS